jgi:hypothetical protein
VDYVGFCWDEYVYVFGEYVNKARGCAEVAKRRVEEFWFSLCEVAWRSPTMWMVMYLYFVAISCWVQFMMSLYIVVIASRS